MNKNALIGMVLALGVGAILLSTNPVTTDDAVIIVRVDIKAGGKLHTEIPDNIKELCKIRCRVFDKNSRKNRSTEAIVIMIVPSDKKDQLTANVAAIAEKASIISKDDLALLEKDFPGLQDMHQFIRNHVDGSASFTPTITLTQTPTS